MTAATDVERFAEYVCDYHATDRPGALAPVAPAAVLRAAVLEYVADRTARPWAFSFTFDGDTLDRETVRDRVRAAQRADRVRVNGDGTVTVLPAPLCGLCGRFPVWREGDGYGATGRATRCARCTLDD